MDGSAAKDLRGAHFYGRHRNHVLPPSLLFLRGRERGLASLMVFTCYGIYGCA
jgi:hypothetical protein